MKRIFAILTFISIILLSSCQVTENIIISDGENTSESDIIVYDFFIDVLNDFSAFVSDESQDESIMDAAVRGFADGLASNPDNSNIIYTKGSGNEYKLSFDFKSISNALSALNGAEGNSVLKEGENSLSFYLATKPEQRHYQFVMPHPNAAYNLIQHYTQWDVCWK